MTVVSSIICDAFKLDNLRDGVIVRLKTASGTGRCAVAETPPTGRVWRVSGVSGAWSSEDLLDLGTVIVLHLPEK
jgi:hypothetical protein